MNSFASSTKRSLLFVADKQINYVGIRHTVCVIHTHAHARACTYVRTYTDAHTYARTHTRTLTHVHTSAHAPTLKYTHIHTQLFIKIICISNSYSTRDFQTYLGRAILKHESGNRWHSHICRERVGVNGVRLDE